MSVAPDVVPARADQISVLADLHAACFAQPWGTEALARLLATPGAFALLGRWQDAPTVCAGFVLARTAAEESEILSLGVLPSCRRRGLARELLTAAAARALADGATQLLLEVDAGNDPATALYTSIGFIEVGRRPGYYRQADGQRRDARIMCLTLPD